MPQRCPAALANPSNVASAGDANSPPQTPGQSRPHASARSRLRAAFYPPRRPRILARDADRLVALFEKSCFVNNQNAVFPGRGQMLTGVPQNLIPKHIGALIRATEENLNRVRTSDSEILRHLPTIFPLHASKKSADIPLRVPSCVSTAKTAPRTLSQRRKVICPIAYNVNRYVLLRSRLHHISHHIRKTLMIRIPMRKSICNCSIKISRNPRCARRSFSLRNRSGTWPCLRPTGRR